LTIGVKIFLIKNYETWIRTALVFVVGVELFAHYFAVVETTSNTHPVRKARAAAMRANGICWDGGFPIGPTVSLVGLTNTFLRNWHGQGTSDVGDLQTSRMLC
jgi:hypothetical protein